MAQSPVAVPLLPKGEQAVLRQKPLTWFGYLPLWSECVPLDAATGRPDWAGVAANVGAGLVIGMREALGGIVSASLVFSTAGVPELSGMFPFGIGMMWYSTSLGALWYAIFGRLQYAYGTAQDVIGILQAVMLAKVAEELTEAGEPEKIQATALAVICLSAVLTGLCSVLIGKMGLGKFALLFPSPVTNGFLGAIGFVILRSSLQTASGVKFEQFYPVSLADFCRPGSLAQVGLQISTVLFIRSGPQVIQACFPGSAGAQKLGGVACQLLPLLAFHAFIHAVGISMDSLTERGWLYPRENSGGAMSHWTTYSPRDVDGAALAGSLVEMPPVVLMAVLCTATGALTVSDRFPRGPDGDPSPMEALNFDRELTTVGVSSTLLGLTGGTCTFHTFTSIQLRLDGGTHRVAVLSVALFVLGAFASGAPIGHYIPKWFLSGLFMNTAFHFLKGALLSYKSLPKVYWRGHPVPSMQYIITLSAIGTSVFFSPATAIFTGMVLSISLFLVQASRTSPVINVVVGDRVVSRTKRPFWEMRVLRREGHRILLLYLQGQLFFGSARRLVAVLTAAIAGEQVEYCILSFARVSLVDASAARHLKSMQEKATISGCRVICCRTNHDVFGALTAAEVITAPDVDLIKYLQGFRWRTRTRQDGRGEHELAADEEQARAFMLNRASLPEARPVAEPDAFAHETDALDWCDERVVSDFCYCSAAPGHPVPLLEPYMLAYRAACVKGAPLEEWAFEDLNNLPRGLLGQLKPYCEVMQDMAQWQKMQDVYGSLCFIFRGSVSLVQMLPHAEHMNLLEPQAKGFSFREGKRLRRRYPPGHVVGKVAFFLKATGQVVDPELVPKLIISSKMSTSADVWVLRRNRWDELPQDLQVPLTSMLCAQLADDAQHSQLQEH